MLFQNITAITALGNNNVDEVRNTYVYIIDDMFVPALKSLHDGEITLEELSESPGVQRLSIERLVQFYLAWENVHAHAYNVKDR